MELLRNSGLPANGVTIQVLVQSSTGDHKVRVFTDAVGQTKLCTVSGGGGSIAACL
jgi:hypothetical protein